MAEKIEVRQAVGKNGHRFAFDNVVWIDGERERIVAHVGHGAQDPIQWRDQVPEAIAEDVRKAVAKHAAERKAKHEQQARDERSDGKANRGGRPETRVN